MLDLSGGGELTEGWNFLSWLVCKKMWRGCRVLSSGSSTADAPGGHSDMWFKGFYKFKHRQLVKETIFLTA